LVGAFVGVGLGVLFLAIGFNRPSIANMRTIDLVHLLGTGACLGAGLVALVVNLVGRRSAVQPPAPTQDAKSQSN
jgi:hypothetical protein